MNNKKYHIFCDESGIVDEDFMIMGGVIFPSHKFTIINQEIINIKEKYNKISHEVKFEKLTSNNNYEFYVEIFEVFLNNKIDYRCMIIDKKKNNHSKYNSDQNEKKHQNEQGFHKFYYTLLNCCFLQFDTHAVYNCFLDQIPATSRPKNPEENLDILSIIKKPNIEIIKTCLNAPYFSRNPFQVLKWIDSKNSNLIQIADLLSGMVMFEKNKKHEIATKSNKYKIQFLNHMRLSLNKQTISEQTPYKDLSWKIFCKQ
jgi:hypothetical protein